MSLTVTESVTVKLTGLGPISVYDSATVTESIGRKLNCNINVMGLATGLQLWSKLESTGDVTSPSVGTGGSEIGSPTYVASKFNNGILSDVASEGCKFPTAANNINLDKGTIEIWAKLNFDPTDGAKHTMWNFNTAFNGGIDLLFSNVIDDFYLAARSGGSGVATIQTTGLSWSSGDLVHFAATWDREGNDIGGGKTLALYVNNVLEASSTDTWDTDTVNADLVVGLHYNETTNHSDAVIDNLKTYNIVKTDFSDKDTETALVAGEGITLSESVTMAGMSYVSVNDSIGLTDANAVIVRANFCPRVSDNLTVTESIARKLISNLSVNDTLTVSEYITNTGQLGHISVSDNVGLTEYIKTKLVNFISESETVTISESITILRSFPGISVSDAITITERIWANMWQERSKETDTWTERTKETDEWVERTKEDDEWTERTSKEAP